MPAAVAVGSLNSRRWEDGMCANASRPLLLGLAVAWSTMLDALGIHQQAGQAEDVGSSMWMAILMSHQVGMLRG